MKTFIHENCHVLPDKLHSLIQESYVKEVNVFNTSMHSLLASGFELNHEERFKYLAACEQEVFKFCVAEVKQVFMTQVNQHLFAKFNQGFKKDEKGQNRNWKELEEAKITDLFKVNKALVEDSLNQFKMV
jgi:hypothetical protein